ncbi:Beta-ketoadipate enol-lactone hydrolase, putative [Lunatimonas lonarensis]|uniref:Beta-ketoadipate enol-lactone hydrolase, putative n=1 Tax=Lunatimonas lonarensis TaxID=1232681 RepID=R7ZMQ0_9BACT|nr:alpha/beta hydrolase [Lunatimonas lonarensis]EON75289.1 Beta-ketoadipate enol-lactone hydrolase, putative [Lunatimonas lonarensis]
MLHYTTFRHSHSKEWVTFIHGAGGSSAIWYKQLRDFSKEYNVLLVDLRGHGRSKNVEYERFKKYTFDVIGDEVIEVLDHLSIDRTHFIGISLGTIIIREISERYPERVQSLILAGAVMKLNTRGQLLMWMGVLLKSLIPYLLLYKLFAFVIMPRKKHRESRYLFIAEAKKLYQKEFIRWFTLVSQVNPLLSFFRLNEVNIPTLYVMGAEDYMFLPTISRLVQNHPSAKLSVIPDCGHVVNVDKPVQFNTIALGFLGDLSQRSFSSY